MAAPQEESTELLEIWAAMEEAVRGYTAERRKRVAPFCAQHYSWKGMRPINLAALRVDFLTNPLNLLWAVPHALLRAAVEWSRRLGWTAPVEWFKGVPVKFKTGSQKRIEWLLITEVLELPFDHGSRHSSADALAAEFFRTPKLAALRGREEWTAILYTDPPLWHNELVADSNQRSAAADFASGVAILLAGWWFIGNATGLNIFGMGEQYARHKAHDRAVQNFSLGGIHLGPKVDHKLGGYYYDFFPPDPTTAQILGGTTIIMVGIACLSLVLHVVIVPLQQKMHLHEKRTQQFLTALENRLLTNVRSDMAARIFATRYVKAPGARPKREMVR